MHLVHPYWTETWLSHKVTILPCIPFKWTLLTPSPQSWDKVRIQMAHQNFARLNSCICLLCHLPKFCSAPYVYENFYTWFDLSLGLTIILGDFDGWFSPHLPNCLVRMAKYNDPTEWLISSKIQIQACHKMVRIILADHKRLPMICNFTFYHSPPNPCSFNSGNRIFCCCCCFFTIFYSYKLIIDKIKLLFYDHRELTAYIKYLVYHT